LAHKAEQLPYYRVPGIVLAHGPAGWRARVQGTGIDVFEVIRTYRNVGWDANRLAAAYHWLTAAQLEAALAYYKAYPEEIDARLKREDALDAESVRTRIAARQRSSARR
jgi:uncharacterized protein (DUF433 family)